MAFVNSSTVFYRLLQKLNQFLFYDFVHIFLYFIFRQSQHKFSLHPAFFQPLSYGGYISSRRLSVSVFYILCIFQRVYHFNVVAVALFSDISHCPASTQFSCVYRCFLYGFSQKPCGNVFCNSFAKKEIFFMLCMKNRSYLLYSCFSSVFCENCYVKTRLTAKKGRRL